MINTIKNEEKERVWIQLTSPDYGLLMEQYVYKAGFFRFNWHNSYEILIILKGSIQAFIEGRTITLEEDDIIVINPMEGHATMLTSDNTTIFLTHLYTEQLPPFSGSQTIFFNCQSNFSNRYTTEFSLLRYYLASSYVQLKKGTAESNLFAEGAYRIVCSILLNHFSNSNIPSAVPFNKKQMRQLKQILTYTNSHYKQKIRLEDLASQLSLNHTYLSYFFHKHMGISYYEYLTRIRLRQAIYLLNNTDKSIIELALESGFPDAKAFSTAFKHYFNSTPGRYRKNLNKNIYSEFTQPLPIYLDINQPIVQNKLAKYSTPFCSEPENT